MPLRELDGCGRGRRCWYTSCWRRPRTATRVGHARLPRSPRCAGLVLPGLVPVFLTRCLDHVVEHTVARVVVSCGLAVVSAPVAWVGISPRSSLRSPRRCGLAASAPVTLPATASSGSCWRGPRHGARRRDHPRRPLYREEMVPRCATTSTPRLAGLQVRTESTPARPRELASEGEFGACRHRPNVILDDAAPNAAIRAAPNHLRIGVKRS